MADRCPSGFRRIAARLGISYERLAEFCRRHGIARLDVFGSILGESFRPDSDLDVLATFAPGRVPTLFEHMVMERELAALAGRAVDLVTSGAVEASDNVLMRDEVLSTREMIYAE